MPLDNYYAKREAKQDDRIFYVVGYHFRDNNTGLVRKVVVSWLDKSIGQVVLIQNP